MRLKNKRSQYRSSNVVDMNNVSTDEAGRARRTGSMCLAHLLCPSDENMC